MWSLYLCYVFNISSHIKKERKANPIIVMLFNNDTYHQSYKKQRLFSKDQ